MTKNEFIKRMTDRYKSKFATPEQMAIYMADCRKHLSDYIDFAKLEDIIVQNFNKCHEFPTVAEFLKYKSDVLAVPKVNEMTAEDFKKLKETSVPPPPELKKKIEELKNKLSIKQVTTEKF